MTVKLIVLAEYDDGSLLKVIKVESDGVLYLLEEAYEIGFLSQRDLIRYALS